MLKNRLSVTNKVKHLVFAAVQFKSLLGHRAEKSHSLIQRDSWIYAFGRVTVKGKCIDIFIITR